MTCPTFIHEDGTITIYPDGAIVERDDSWKLPKHWRNITNRYIVQWETTSHDKRFYSLADPTTTHQTQQSHAELGRVLVELPKGFDTSTLTEKHAPIELQLWYHTEWNADVLRSKFYNNIASALKDARSMVGTFGTDFSVEVTSAGGKYTLFDEFCNPNQDESEDE